MSDVDDLINQISDWSLAPNPRVDSLVEQITSLNLGGDSSRDALATPVHDQATEHYRTEQVSPRPYSSFPQYQAEYCTRCSKAPPALYQASGFNDVGWFHEHQCEGCGLSDYGREWWKTQKAAIDNGAWMVWVCTLVDGTSHTPFWEPQQFWTQNDALEYAFWMAEQTPSLSYELHSYQSPFDTRYNHEQWKGWDYRQTSQQAISKWCTENHRFIDRNELRTHLESLEIFHNIEPVVATGHGAIDYALLDRKCSYKTGQKEFYRSVVWKKFPDGWHFAERKPNESDYALYCRLMNVIIKHDAISADWSYSPLISNYHKLDVRVPDFKFAVACRTRKAYPGKYCVKDNWVVFLPQRNSENPDQFRVRYKKFKQKYAKRQKRKQDKFGSYIVKFRQQPGETLAQFVARVREEPGEEITNPRTARPDRGMMLDWAS